MGNTYKLIWSDEALENLKGDHSEYFRRAVISKQVSVFYQIQNQVVHIISVFDNRQNPSRLKKN